MLPWQQTMLGVIDMAQKLSDFLLNFGFKACVDPLSGEYILKDLEGGNLGGIEDETYASISSIVERLDVYYDSDIDDLLCILEAEKVNNLDEIKAYSDFENLYDLIKDLNIPTIEPHKEILFSIINPESIIDDAPERELDNDELHDLVSDFIECASLQDLIDLNNGESSSVFDDFYLNKETLIDECSGSGFISVEDKFITEINKLPELKENEVYFRTDSNSHNFKIINIDEVKNIIKDRLLSVDLVRQTNILDNLPEIIESVKKYRKDSETNNSISRSR